MKHWNLLLPFVAVMTEGTFTGAAKRMGISPAALSQNIAQLEKFMGVRLFHRTTRQIHPTDEATVLFNDVGELVAILDEKLKSNLLNINEMSGTIRMSLSPAYARSKALPILAKFLYKFPDINLELLFDNNMESPAKSGVDIAIRHGAVHDGFIARALNEMKTILIASPQYLKIAGTPVLARELSNHMLIMCRMPNARIVNWTVTRNDDHKSLSKKQYRPEFASGRNRSVTIAGQMDAVRDAALSGMGIGAIYSDYVQEDIEHGRLHQVLEEYTINIDSMDVHRVFIEYPSKSMLSPKVRLMVDFLIDNLGDNLGDNPGS